MSFEAQYDMEASPFARGAKVLVHQCRSRATGAVCAAKVYAKADIPHRRYDKCLLEAEIGRAVPAHPNVMRVLEVFDEAERVVLVCEYMKGGTLFELLTTGGPLPEDRAGRLTYQLLQGLDHLHKSGVMHRDIKPENLFFRSGARDVIVIGDFGFATTEIPSTGYMGSPQYSAPELALIGLHRDEASALKAMYNEKCDLWSIGVVLFVMLTGLLPFDGLTPTRCSLPL
ncbi:protein kinase [Strigomonas culicis]|uniref:Protein kinase n=1 Tax=Strigomonas culicis TaxID=28005 RepID=S9VYI6_9TRYP|nr:protein kinase [Strigomonas culicis]|eukprot:EPY32136.1 protein kinase [Strigomonas culicis]